MANEPLYLIDGSGYVFRAYYAVRRLTTAAGFSTNAVFGFTNMLLRVLKEHRPTHLAIAFDAGGKTFRHALYDGYKANRPPPPEDLPPQLPFITKVVDAFRIPQFRVKGVEADDVIGTLALRAAAAGVPVRIITGDKDFMQLVDDRVHLIDELRIARATGNDDTEVDPAAVERKFGVPPSHVVDVLALAGDASDNVPGVKGIGEKTAAELVKMYGHVEDILARAHEIKQNARRERLVNDAANARLSKELVTIKTDVDDVTYTEGAFRYEGPDTEALRALFTELEFRRLLDDPILTASRASSSSASPSVPSPKGAKSTKAGASPQGDLFAPASAAPVDDAPAHEARVRAPSAIDLVIATSRAELARFVDDEIPAKGPVGLALLTDSVERAGERVVGIALSPRAHRVLYLPLAGEQALALDDVRNVLAPLLTRTEGFVVDDAKHALRAFRDAGLPAFHIAADLGIASYLLDPDAGAHDAVKVAERVLHEKIPTREDVLGKGKSARAAAVANLDDVAALTAVRGDVAFRARAPLDAMLTDAGMHALYASLELPLSPVLAEMERTGVLVDTARLAHLGHDFEEELRSLEARAHEIAGEPFNLASPTQVAALLFEKLGLAAKKKTKTGLSTDASVLEELKDEHPLPGIILEHRELAKLKGTYVDALPRLVRADTGRIHTHFHQTVAATGRLSSSDPNLQNIPTRKTIGKKIREAFIAPKGRVLVSLDYSQVELRLLAHASSDPVLIDTFQKGEDVHQRTASEIFSVPLDAVTKTQRNAAKTINFGLLYGMGVHRLSGELGIKRSEAKAFLERYFERYAGIASWKNAVLAEANAEGAVRTLFGRRRLLPELRSQNRGEVALGERLAINTPIQGTAADLIKRAMIDAHAALSRELPSARLLLQVHDELLVEVDASDAERATEIVREKMVHALALKVPLVVDAAHGPSWADIH